MATGITSDTSPAQETVLVTGASGFIGSRLVRHLVSAGMSVRALDLDPPRDHLPGVQYLDVDVRRPIASDIGRDVTRIYNLAAIHKTPGHPDRAYYDTNVEGALNVTQLAETCNIPTVVFTSSIAVYGHSEQHLDENSPLQPQSAYGHSKCLAEDIHTGWCNRDEGRKLVIVRPGVLFGPGERGNYTRLATALSRGLFVYPGRPSVVKSCGHVDELLNALDFAISNPDRCIVFNFAYPHDNTLKEIVATFHRVAGFPEARAIAPAPLLYLAAWICELAPVFGIETSVCRARVTKLTRSTKILPNWLLAQGYCFKTNLEQALVSWRDESNGAFV